MNVKVKMCGMTNIDDCLAAIDNSVDLVGFVFYRRSKRFVDARRVRKMVEKICGRIETVGVFVEEGPAEVKEIMEYCELNYAQVYPGELATADTGKPGPRLISVYRVRDVLPDKFVPGLVLFDSYSEGFGGSGRSFDFDILRGHEVLGRAFIAGGLSLHNVKEALALGPYGIDLVSSVEREPGIKDRGAVEKFMRKVRSSSL